MASLSQINTYFHSTEQTRHKSWRHRTEQIYKLAFDNKANLEDFSKLLLAGPTLSFLKEETFVTS